MENIFCSGNGHLETKHQISQSFSSDILNCTSLGLHSKSLELALALYLSASLAVIH